MTDFREALVRPFIRGSARAMAWRRASQAARGTVVLAPPSPEINRGDEALLRVLIEGLARRGHAPLIAVDTGRGQLATWAKDLPVEIETRFWPAFASPRAVREQLGFLGFLRPFRHVVLVGADVVDEGYANRRGEASLLMLDLARRAGLVTHLVSFSINTMPSPALQRRFERLTDTRKCVRDPVSYQRLSDAGIGGLDQVADLAFLLEPAPAEALPPETAAFLDRHAGRVVGLNLIGKVLGHDAAGDARRAAWRQVCQRMAAQGEVAWLGLPHDDREDIDDLRRLFADLTTPETASRVHLVDPVPSAAVLKRLAGGCRHVFTCRMHLAIATLGMARPVTGFPYQGKFEGLFAHLDLPADGLVPADSLPTEPDRLEQLVRQRLDAADAWPEHLTPRLPAIRELAERNFFAPE